MEKEDRKNLALPIIASIVLWGFIVAQRWDIVLAFTCGALLFGVLLVLPGDNS